MSGCALGGYRRSGKICTVMDSMCEIMPKSGSEWLQCWYVSKSGRVCACVYVHAHVRGHMCV